MKKPRIFISTSSFGRVSPEPLDALDRAGYSYRLNPHSRKLEAEETREALAGVDGLIAGTELLDRGILTAADSLKAISRVGTGLESVDLVAAEELGIRVSTTPDPPARAVAELALGGLLAVLRHLVPADRDLRRGSWQKPMGQLLSGKTVGIIGTGRAGRALVDLLSPFHCRHLAVDLQPDPAWAQQNGVEYTRIDSLLTASDVVSLHVPLSPETRNLLDRRRIELMKHGAVLVNCARGGLVDEAALAENLRDGRLAGAYLDVFEDEPYHGGLIELRNTLLTPHIGSYAAECRLQMELEAVENLVRALAEAGDTE
ncbi:MAG: phosphoglycerate dehydrogenase [bacterium]|nr:phosphoglycerate dehydrogenase [bacterium]